MFLQHPLLVTLQTEPVLSWHCRIDVPDKEAYELVSPVETYLSAVSLQALNTLLHNTGSNMLRWLLRRGITVHAAASGVLDIPGKRLYKVDMVAERDGQLTLILVYFSTRRGGHGWRKMLEYGAAVRAVLSDQYRLDGDVIILNFYGNGQVRGVMVDA